MFPAIWAWFRNYVKVDCLGGLILSSMIAESWQLNPDKKK